MSTTILTDNVETPIGSMLLMVENDVMIGLEFDDQPERYMKDLRRRYPDMAIRAKANPCGFSDRLRAYYAGDLAAVDRSPCKRRRHAVPGARLGRVKAHQDRDNDFLWRARRQTWRQERDARGRPCQWPQSDLGCGAMSSRDRL